MIKIALSLIFFFFLTKVFGQTTYDVLIKNGKIIDGTGNNWYYGNLALKDGKIVAIGKNVMGTANKIIDATGLIIAPGFIDVHTHSENIITKPTADNFIYDGVTTLITGNCGSSNVDLKKFFYSVDSARPSVNMASLIGHNSVRIQVMGYSDKVATNTELQQMELLVAQGMKDGAVGFSTGLIYIPGTYSNTDEVVSLAKQSAKYNGIYASHIRNEESGVLDAINEAIDIGRKANLPVEISHFKAGYKANFGKSKAMVALVEAARKEGLDVTVDQYPYTASSTNLGVRLPDWAFVGGNDSLLKRIENPQQHQQIIKEMLEQIKKYKQKNYAFAVVANCKADSTLNGKNISQINTLKGRKSKAKEEAETILDIMKIGGAQMVYHSMSEDDIKYIMQYPFNMIASDAGVATGVGMPHPRAYGTNARVLGKYVREEKVMHLEEAIRRMTSLPAQKFQLKDRGLLKEGMAADIVVFDENKVTDFSTFESPHQFSGGFKFVLVNGKIIIDENKHTGERGGVVLYGLGKQ
jgi:N-acyl-D-amino-acid deacylase